MSSNLIVVNEDDLAKIFKNMFAESLKDFITTSDFKNLVQSIFPQSEKQKLLSIDEAAAYLHLKPNSIYTLTSRKKMPQPIKKGKRVFFFLDELEKWDNEGRPSCEKSIDEIVDEAISVANSKRKVKNQRVKHG